MGYNTITPNIVIIIKRKSSEKNERNDNVLSNAKPDRRFVRKSIANLGNFSGIL
jgi:hypothetical protein